MGQPRGNEGQLRLIMRMLRQSLGLRLSYDLIGRSVSPYAGVNYERAFGGTADILRDHGHEVDELTGVVGVNFMF
ncbi:copper resistance protein B [Thioclava sp. GXIMD4216]|uniref:copper resistance protein B n=1 Tax=Thioclava sp. GXIMD4216 TaxID=3131929 RepID=UPI0030CD91DC